LSAAACGWTFWAASGLVIAFLVSLVLRRAGSYYAPIDGWGVDLFELSMGALCVSRYFEASWQSSRSVTRVFPLVLGAGCILWGLGDVVTTIESLGGATPAVPSPADGFYVGFFPSVRQLHNGDPPGERRLVGGDFPGRDNRRPRRGLDLCRLVFNTVLKVAGGAPCPPPPT